MSPFPLTRRTMLAASLLSLAACKPSSAAYHGIDLRGARYAEDFELKDPDGRVRRMADFRGKAVLLFFGFTQCPDVCPTALSRAAAVRELLGKEAHRLQVVFVTLDPERDTPPVLRSYTQAFDPSFIGLYTDVAGTAQTAKAFKVFYNKVPTGDSYTLDHSTLSYLFDAEGRLRLALKHEFTAAQVAEDVRQVLIA